MKYIGILLTIGFTFVYAMDSDEKIQLIQCDDNSDICYSVVYSSSLMWQEARDYCRSNFPNGDLPSIHNMFQNSLIYATYLSGVNIDDGFWIGISNFNQLDGSYHWSDESYVDYENWVIDDPSNGTYQCGRMAVASSKTCEPGQWNTENCAQSYHFLCQHGKIDTSTTTTITTTTLNPAQENTDCLDIQLKNASLPSGIYEIWPFGPYGRNVTVWCDMETDGGGWTAIHRRRLDIAFDWSNYLYWSDYKNGFHDGNYSNLWLGLDISSQLSLKDAKVALRVDLGYNSSTATITYKAVIQSESDKYRLVLMEKLSGDSILEPAMEFHNFMRFTTKDQDNDGHTTNCAVIASGGGWWYNSCFRMNLNSRDAIYRFYDESCVFDQFDVGGSQRLLSSQLSKWRSPFHPQDVPEFTCTYVWHDIDESYMMLRRFE